MFSFKGVQDSSMGIMALPYSRTMKPEQRVVQTYVQGRNGTYDWSDGTFANGTISIPCKYFGSTAPATIRAVAAWLSGSGDLIIDDEPDKHYEAHLYQSMDIERELFEDGFTLVFSVFPFAMSDLNTKTAELTYSGEEVTVKTSGTAPTPCLMTFINTGSATINNMVITLTLADGRSRSIETTEEDIEEDEEDEREER